MGVRWVEGEELFAGGGGLGFLLLIVLVLLLPAAQSKCKSTSMSKRGACPCRRGHGVPAPPRRKLYVPNNKSPREHCGAL